MPLQPKKILLLGAGFTTRNMGVWALASGAITSIWYAYPDAQIYLFDYHTKPAQYQIKHQGGTGLVQLINLRFSKKFWLRNNIARLLMTAILIKMLPSRSIQNRLISRNFWLSHVQTADIVGSIAGGDSFSDIYGIGRLIYVSLPQILALLLNKQLVLLPQTIGPFKSKLGRAIARFIIKHASKIFSREKANLEKIRGIVPVTRNKILFCYDMGFVLEPRIVEERIPRCIARHDRRIPLVGFNVSGLLYIGGYTGKNMFGLKVDYRKLVHDLIDHFVRKHNAHVILVPHVIGSVENSESDIAACHKIYHKTNKVVQENLYIINGAFDQHEFKALIGFCDFFIGSRMHACIAALSQSIPAVGLAYSRKFQGVFASIGVDDLVFDLREQDSNYLIENVVRAYERREHFRTHLEAKMPSVRTCVLDFFVNIGADCITDVKVHV